MQLLMLTILYMACAIQQVEAQQRVILKLNVGYVLKYRSTMNLKVDQAILNFAVQLPEITEPKAVKLIDCSSITVNQSNSHENNCRIIFEFIKAIYIVHTQAVNAIHERVQNIHQTFESFPINQKSTRARLTHWGSPFFHFWLGD